MREWVSWLEGWVTLRVATLVEVLQSCPARVKRGERAAIEQVDALLHQPDAVYRHPRRLPRTRFLPAVDPRAGKTQAQDASGRLPRRRECRVWA